MLCKYVLAAKLTALFLFAKTLFFKDGLYELTNTLCDRHSAATQATQTAVHPVNETRQSKTLLNIHHQNPLLPGSVPPCRNTAFTRDSKHQVPSSRHRRGCRRQSRLHRPNRPEPVAAVYTRHQLVSQHLSNTERQMKEGRKSIQFSPGNLLHITPQLVSVMRLSSGGRAKPHQHWFPPIDPAIGLPLFLQMLLQKDRLANE